MNPNNNTSFYGQKLSKLGVNVTEASDSQLIWKDDYNNAIKIWYDENNARIAEGKLPDGSYGLWVSKPGFNVTDANAAINNELIFNSNQDIFKIYSSGIVNGSVTNGSPTYTNSIAHNLGRIPGVLVYGQMPPSSAYSPFSTIIPTYSTSAYTALPAIQFAEESIGGTGTYFPIFELTYEIDKNNLTLIADLFVTGETGPFNFSFSYFILQESIF